MVMTYVSRPMDGPQWLRAITLENWIATNEAAALADPGNDVIVAAGEEDVEMEVEARGDWPPEGCTFTLREDHSTVHRLRYPLLSDPALSTDRLTEMVREYRTVLVEARMAKRMFPTDPGSHPLNDDVFFVAPEGNAPGRLTHNPAAVKAWRTKRRKAEEAHCLQRQAEAKRFAEIRNREKIVSECRRFGEEARTLFRFCSTVFWKESRLELERYGDIGSLRRLVELLDKLVRRRKIRRWYRCRRRQLPGVRWHEVRDALRYLVSQIDVFVNVTLRKPEAAPFVDAYRAGDLSWLRSFLRSETAYLRRTRRHSPPKRYARAA